MERNIYDRVLMGVPKLLTSKDKIGIKKNIRNDLKKAKKAGNGYDSFDEEWIVDKIRSEDKVYYGSDTDISAIESELSHSDTDSDMPMAYRKRRYRVSQNPEFLGASSDYYDEEDPEQYPNQESSEGFEFDSDSGGYYEYYSDQESSEEETESDFIDTDEADELLSFDKGSPDSA